MVADATQVSYLIFDTGVINIRKFASYEVRASV
jgi:hypothetical protein